MPAALSIQEHREKKTEKEHKKIRDQLIFVLLDLPLQLMQELNSEACKPNPNMQNITELEKLTDFLPLFLLEYLSY